MDLGKCDAPTLSFGNRLVAALVQQLKGQLAVANRPGAYFHLQVGEPLVNAQGDPTRAEQLYGYRSQSY